MAEPFLCTRCSPPLDAPSATGLCPACALASQTRAERPADAPPRAPDTPQGLADGTPVGPAPNPFAATRTGPDLAPTAPRAPESDLPADPDGFTLIRPLGGGGMGDVYLAHEEVTNRVVAVKFPGAADPPPPANTHNAAADPTPASAAHPDPHAPTHTAPDGAATASAPPAPPARPERGQPSDPPGYEIVDKIGRGGMGAVYIARETVSKQIVALKFLRDPDAPDVLTRFELEFRALREVVHPNVVRVLGHDFQRGDAYFVLEYLEGGSLADKLKGGPLDPTVAVDLIRKVAGAVQAMHEKAGILHRDIKPGNILLTNEGAPKLADFGLAKFLDATTVHTLSGGMLGTLRYMPPEQINGKNGTLGYPADVYGLGATLYHLLTGHPPFVRDEFDELLFAVLHDAPTDPRAIRSELKRGLSGVVMKCLEKDPRHRYQTVADFLAALDCWADKDTPLPVPVRERLRKWVRRNAKALAACALLAVAGGAVALIIQQPDPAETIRKELRTTHRTTLVGPNGEVRTHRWTFGGGTVGKAARGDGLYIEAIDKGYLELLDDPGVESYTLRAEIRQTRALGHARGAGRRNDEDMVGVYFGYLDASSEQTSAIAHLAMWFGDFDPQVPPPANPRPQPVSLLRVLMTNEPNGDPVRVPSAFAQLQFTPNVTRPGPWRTLEVEVTPTEVRPRWLAKDGKTMKSLVGIPPLDPRHQFATLQDDLNTYHPQSGITLPAWNSRRGLGIVVTASAVNVRNVTVTIPN